jgi:hypothetical protein
MFVLSKSIFLFCSLSAFSSLHRYLFNLSTSRLFCIIHTFSYILQIFWKVAIYFLVRSSRLLCGLATFHVQLVMTSRTSSSDAPSVTNLLPVTRYTVHLLFSLCQSYISFPCYQDTYSSFSNHVTSHITSHAIPATYL